MKNFVFISGRAGKDMEIKYLPNGTALGEFSVAVSKKVKDQWVSQWFRCKAWATTAESLRGVLLKGCDVSVAGELDSRQFETKDGQKREVVEIIAWSVTVQPKREKPEFKVEEPRFTSEDIPF